MATKKSALTKEKIVSMYMNYTLENNEKPKSVYKFTKINEISETEFYNFFGTIESVEKEIFKMFYDKTIELLHKDKEEKKTHRTLRHIWLPLRTGDRFAAKRAFILPTHPSPPTTLENWLTSNVKKRKISEVKIVF